MPRAQPQLQAAVGDLVGGGRLAREHRGVPEPLEDEGTDAHPVSGFGDGHDHWERRGTIATEVVRDEQHLVAAPFGIAAGASQRVPRSDRADVAPKPEPTHGGSLRIRRRLAAVPRQPRRLVPTGDDYGQENTGEAVRVSARAVLPQQWAMLTKRALTAEASARSTGYGTRRIEKSVTPVRL